MFDIALAWALYVVLKPIDRNVALLAAFWRLAEASNRTPLAGERRALGGPIQ